MLEHVVDDLGPICELLNGLLFFAATHLAMLSASLWVILRTGLLTWRKHHLVDLRIDLVLRIPCLSIGVLVFIDLLLAHDPNPSGRALELTKALP